MEVGIAQDPWDVYIYMTVKQEEKQDAMERDSGVFPIVLPRDILLSGLGCVVYFYHLQAG